MNPVYDPGMLSDRHVDDTPIQPRDSGLVPTLPQVTARVVITAASANLPAYTLDVTGPAAVVAEAVAAFAESVRTDQER